VGEPAPTAPELVEVSLRVNGDHHSLTIDTRTSLLDLLREQLGLTGAKKGCDHGQCGACTVLIDGLRANACLALAVAHRDADVTTIEGLADGEELHPLQRAFVEHDGFQCGYCTPGQICSAVGMLDELARGWPSHASPDLTAEPRLSPDEVRERMSGNICRCGAYPNILAAIEEVGR
jgi:xanthine dehydrogenase YagT iron-sulfur-binding subunit